MDGKPTGKVGSRDASTPLGICQAKFFYNGEFDPGSGLTLAAGLIHASRGAARVSTWRRPADGCVTRMQPTFHRGIARRNPN